MARRDGPAPQDRRSSDDPVPPQEGYRVGLGQSMTLEIAYNLRALSRVAGHRLADKERVEKPVSRPRIIHWRQIMRDVLGHLNGWVVEEIAREIECDIKIAVVDDLLPIPNVSPVLGRCYPNVAPALDE